MGQKRIAAPGQALVIAPSGGLVVNQGYLDGVVFGVVGDTVLEGEETYIETEGAFPLPYGGGSTGSKNADAFWDNTDKAVYASYAAGRLHIGTFYQEAASAATICFVMLGGRNTAAAETGDISEVIAGAGMVGGGASGSVTVSADFGTGAGKVCEGNDARLSDARTPSSTLAHAASHAAAGTDAITPAAIGAQAVVPAAVENNLASFDAAGSTKDSGITAASIAGAVTMGEIHNDNMRNSTSTAQSLADATETVVDLEDAELVGDVTYAAGTTSLATIPVGGTGLYVINYGATFAAGAGTYNQIAIKISGTTRSDRDETPDNANPIVVENGTVLRLAAGDTVGLYAKQDSGGALNVTDAYMAIQRMQ